MAKKNGKKNGVPKRTQKSKNGNGNRFGPVSTINTAPVAIGNSIRGSKPVVVNSANGCRVIGRDFAFEAKATVAAAVGWSLIGGMPITPSVLATSSLRAYAQLFSQFQVNKWIVHYITSSPTTQAGDIMFYYERERNSPMIDFTNNSFLPFVLSDPTTIIGPQWMNHSAMFDPVKEWRSTNYGLNSDLNEESAGSIFLFSKTNAANSPGYILIDFDITFKEMCVNPRAGIIPVTRGLWNYLTFTNTALAVTSGTTVWTPTIAGNDPNGIATALPTGAALGDIYKVIFLVTNSTVSGTNSAWTNVTTSNLLVNNLSTGGDVAITIDDGFTCYGVYHASGAMYMHPTLESAKGSGPTFQYGVTATVTYSLCAMISFVGAMGSSTLQSSY